MEPTHREKALNIEKGIAIPAERRTTPKYPVQDMIIGDSFLVDIELRACASNAMKRANFGMTSRKISDEQVRVWRIK